MQLSTSILGVGPADLAKLLPLVFHRNLSEFHGYATGTLLCIGVRIDADRLILGFGPATPAELSHSGLVDFSPYKNWEKRD